MAQHTTGLIMAMAEEIKPLLKGIPQVARETAGPFPLYRFFQDGRQYVIIESGIGASRALAAAGMLTECCSPDLIISIGFGGGATSGLSAGDIVIGTRFLMHSGSQLCEEAGGQPVALPASLRNRLSLAGVSITEGAIISTGGILSKKVLSAILPDHILQAAVDMETCTVARFTAEHGIPFLAVRCISDSRDEELGFSMDEFMDSSMKVSIGKVLLTVMRRPRIIPQLRRLSLNTRTAGKNLNLFFSLCRGGLI